MVICGGRNIVVDVLICGNLILRQFSDKKLLVSQLCISVINLLSTCMSLLRSINLQYNCMSSAYECESTKYL